MTCHCRAALVSDTVFNRSGDLRDTKNDFENGIKDLSHPINASGAQNDQPISSAAGTWRDRQTLKLRLQHAA